MVPIDMNASHRTCFGFETCLLATIYLFNLPSSHAQIGMLLLDRRVPTAWRRRAPPKDLGFVLGQGLAGCLFEYMEGGGGIDGSSWV